MKWFSKYPKWLLFESTELSNSSVYKERYQFINETFISTGSILVHKEKTEYHPILIVYPKTTPYILPVVYMLKEPLDEDTARKLSFLDPEKIKAQVGNKVRFYSQRRHQNSDGSICFLETGDLHDDKAQLIGVKEIIKRLRDWLSGKIPKDSREVELFAHFSNKTEELQFLLPDIFFDTDICKGLFYAGLSVYLPANLIKDNPIKKTFMGILILGENASGIALPPKIYEKEQLILFTHLPDPPKLISQKKPKEIEDMINDKKLIEGYWWDIDKEPIPFSDIQTLSVYIGQGNQENGIKELVKSLTTPLTKLEEEIYLGLRFPGRWREKDWQMIRLKKGKRLPSPGGGEKELRLRLLDYSIEAIQQEYFTEEYFHMRNQGRADRFLLKTKNVSIIGCGALGSEISDCITKAGIGTMILVDKEAFGAHNAIRHCLGIDHVSFPKVLGMIKHLVFHNPFVNFIPKCSNVLQDDLSGYLPTNYLGISTIADDNIEAYINELAVEEEKIIFYCRALRGGKVGRIFRVIPRTDACKACLSLYKSERNPSFIDVEEDENLPVITNECNNPVRPASAADIKMIASIASIIVIDYLEGRGLEKNHWIWTTEALGKFEINDLRDGIVYSYNIPPHPKCPVCQSLESKEVVVDKDAYALMKAESTNSGDVETGGILIGHIDEKGIYKVFRATGPGPKAKRTSTSFEKDEEYCQKELEKALQELGEQGLYLGEWHYHHQGTNMPSGTDIRSLAEIALQDNYRIEKPIMIILAPKLEFAITIHDKNGQYVQVPFNIVN